MKVEKMIVCNGSGQTETYRLNSEDGSVITTFLEGEVITVANDPFAFYAVRSVLRGAVEVAGQVNGVATTVKKNNGQKAQGNTTIKEVQIVMPLGGKESGLFRQPRVGEKVLIGTEETEGANYLMGYIPSSNKKEDSYFSPAGADKKAEIFRFNNNGANFSDTAYSEIGFYHNPAESFQDVTVPMDSLRINSTGNINALAANKFSLSADSISFRAGGAAKDRASISVDAAGNVTISAKGSISLKTGRTSLSLSDSGFSVKSKIGDTVLSNTWDASISLSPLKGFSAAGLDCKLSAVRKSVMSEKLGGMVQVNMGLGSMKGREIGMNIYNASEFKYLNFVSDLEYVQNMAAFASAEDIRVRSMELGGGEDLLKTQDEAAVATEQANLDLQKARDAYYLLQGATTDAEKASRRDEALKAFDAAEVSENVRKEKTAAYYQKIQEIRRGMVYAQNRADGTKIAFIWANYLNKHLKALYQIYGDWKDLAETKEQLRASYAAAARKRALTVAGIATLTPKEIEERAKLKYEQNNTGKNWDDLDDKTKDKFVREEKGAVEKEEDDAYRKKKKEEYDNSPQKQEDSQKAEEMAWLEAVAKYAETFGVSYDKLTPDQITTIKTIIDNDPALTAEREEMQNDLGGIFEDQYVNQEQGKDYSDTTGLDFHTQGGAKELPPAPTPPSPPAPTPPPAPATPPASQSGGASAPSSGGGGQSAPSSGGQNAPSSGGASAPSGGGASTSGSGGGGQSAPSSGGASTSSSGGGGEPSAPSGGGASTSGSGDSGEPNAPSGDSGEFTPIKKRKPSTFDYTEEDEKNDNDAMNVGSGLNSSSGPSTPGSPPPTSP
jgi:hypothetical protein